MRNILGPAWLRLCEETNALDDLEKVFYFIEQTNEDTKAWKWVILCLHAAIYGFAICALRGTNGRSVLQDNGKLISFKEAIKRSQNVSYMRMTVESKVLELSTSQKDSIQRLSNEFRNGFAHYIPQLWAIEVSGMPDMALDCLDVIRFLALDSGNYSHLKESEKQRVKSLIFRSRKILLNRKSIGFYN